MTAILPSITSNVKQALAISLLILLCHSAACQQVSHQTGTLAITFTQIQSTEGRIRLALYNREDQWTDNPAYHFDWTKENVVNGRLTVMLDSLPRATYACAVLDDINNSGDMEYLLGLPKEGWGMSTNPSFLKLKKPGFRDVCFDLDAPVLRFEIQIYYLGKRR